MSHIVGKKVHVENYKKLLIVKLHQNLRPTSSSEMLRFIFCTVYMRSGRHVANKNGCSSLSFQENPSISFLSSQHVLCAVDIHGDVYMYDHKTCRV